MSRSVLYYAGSIVSQHDALTQYWLNVVPASMTPFQHWVSVLSCQLLPAKTRRLANAVLPLSQGRRQWTSINLALGERLAY